MKIVKWLDDHFEEVLLVICLVLISFVMMGQVIVRKLADFNIGGIQPWTWAEEFCRFAWIWSVFLSLPYTIRKGNMLRVNVLLDLVPQTVRKVINLGVDLVTAASMGMLAYYAAIDTVPKIIQSGELSPAMQWPMAIVYAVMEAGFILATLRGVQMFFVHIMHFNENQLSTIEQTMADAAEEAAAGKKAEGGDK